MAPLRGSDSSQRTDGRLSSLLFAKRGRDGPARRASPASSDPESDAAVIAAAAERGRRATFDSTFSADSSGESAAASRRRLDSISLATGASSTSNIDLLSALQQSPIALSSDRRGRVDIYAALAHGPPSTTALDESRPSISSSVAPSIDIIADRPSLGTRPAELASLYSNTSSVIAPGTGTASSFSFSPAPSEGVASTAPLLGSADPFQRELRASPSRPRSQGSRLGWVSQQRQGRLRAPSLLMQAVPSNPFAPLRKRFMPPRRRTSVSTSTHSSSSLYADARVNETPPVHEKQQLVLELLVAIDDLVACFRVADSGLDTPASEPRSLRAVALVVSEARYNELATELDLVIAEIAETTPEFLAALAQGGYGPLAVSTSVSPTSEAPVPRRAYHAFMPATEHDLRSGWLARLRADVAEALLAAQPMDETGAVLSSDMARASSAELLDAGRRRWERYQAARK